MHFLNNLLIIIQICGCFSCDDHSDRYSEEILWSDGSYSKNLDRRPESKYETWILSLLASCVIGLSGIAPLIFIPLEMSIAFGQDEGSNKYLKLLLSFAVGGLLGDVFLHLLPEAWNYHKNLGAEFGSNHIVLGLWVLLGMFSFIVLEIMFTASKANSTPENKCCTTKENICFNDVPVETKLPSNGSVPSDSVKQNNNAYHQKISLKNGNLNLGEDQKISFSSEMRKHPQQIHVTGYLNLMANSIDNFTHGLAVAASFLIGCKMGILTTFAILIHEIPHEIGDFAILLKSGFHPWTAAKAQISTATIGIFGVIVALSAESIDRVGVCTSWILPFTAGGFLNIALVNVLPDLLNEKDPCESIKQLVCICAGIGVMAGVSHLV